MAIPSWVNSGTAASTSTNATATITPGNPASLVANNLLICVVQTTLATTTQTFSMSAGWTQLAASPFVVLNHNYAVFWKVTTGTEGSNTVTRAGTGSGTFSAQIHQYTGNATSNILGGVHQFFEQDTLDTSNRPGSIRTTAANSLVVCISLAVSNVPTGLAAGWTQRVNNTTALAYSIFDSGQATAGLSGDLWYTYGSTFRGWSIMFEMRSQAPGAVAFPYIKQSGFTNLANAVSSLTCPLPDNLTAGNILWITCSGSETSTQPTATGFTAGPKVNNTGGTTNMWSLWRVIDGTESNPTTVTFSAASNPLVQAHEIVGASTITPFVNLRQQGNAVSTTTMPVAGWTTSRGNVTAVAFHQSTSTNPPTAGMTTPGSWVRYNMGGTDGFHLQEVASVGGTGGFTETFGGNQAWTCATFEITSTGLLPASKAVWIG